MDVSARANSLFERARNQTSFDIDRIMAENSANGRLRSGYTAKQAVAAFGKRTSASLAQLLDEVAKRINHRGSAWKKAMTDIRLALDAQFDLAASTIDPALKVAGAVEGSARRAVDDMISTVANELREQLAEFDQGWTSPNPMKWPERHPVLYAAALLLAGAVAGELAKIPFEHLLK
jgi:hypothetical protein